MISSLKKNKIKSYNKRSVTEGATLSLRNGRSCLRLHTSTWDSVNCDCRTAAYCGLRTTVLPSRWRKPAQPPQTFSSAVFGGGRSKKRRFILRRESPHARADPNRTKSWFGMVLTSKYQYQNGNLILVFGTVLFLLYFCLSGILVFVDWRVLYY